MAGTFDKCQVKAPVDGGYITIADVDMSHLRLAARLKGIELPPEYSAAADEANARLIAAAPDLLEDLLKAQQAINDYIAARQGDPGAPDETTAYNALTRFHAPSLAKAKG